MWKAAFTGRSEGGGSSAGRPSEPRRKRSHRAESVSSSRPREDDERERRRSSRGGSVYESGESSVYGVPRSSVGVGYGSSPSQMAQTAPLTASALRMLPDDEEEWEDEDKDARSERKSRRSDGWERRRKSSGKEREREKGKERERDGHKGKDRSRSDSPEKERKKSASKSSGKERDRERARDSQSEKERDSKRRSQLVESPERMSSRAMPEMGSFEQFPGQYAGGHMGPLPSHQQDAVMSGALPNSAPQQGQFPGQDPYHDANRPPLEPSHSYGAAADYYLDTGESVQHQPGVRVNSPNMLVNPDQHLVAASAQPMPAMDTGNGTANDFYSGKVSPVHGMGVSASAPVTPASKPPKVKPAKQSSWSAFKPSKTSKPGKVSKPSKTSSSSTAAAALAAAGGAAVLSGTSHVHNSSSQQQSFSSSAAYQQGSNSFSANETGTSLPKPNRHSSDNNVYYGPPPQSQSQFQPLGGYAAPPSPSYTYGVPGSTIAQGGSVNAYGAQSTNNGHGGTSYANDYGTAYSTPGKQSTNSNSNVPLYAAGAAAAGLAAYGINQHHQHSSHNMASSGSYGGGGQGPPNPPRPGMGGFSHYPSSGGGGTGMHQLHHEHEHKGPMTRLKDGLFNLISTPEDTAKMEMYTEYIGVCKYCFDPRTSPWDAPRQHHYHRGNRRDSFDELRRRRSNERLGRKGSNDSLRRAGSVRVDKENRYYASDSSRKRRESGKATGILGAGLAAAGVATAANAMFNDGRKDFDDTYSVKSGHRESSAIRRRSRSSSREQRRRATYGIARPSDREEFVTVRRKDGTLERRRVRRGSRSTSREGRSSGLFGAAAGAALDAGAASAGMRRRSRSRDSKGRRSERRSPRSSYGRDEEPVSQGIFGGFFSPPQKRRNSRKEHHKKKKGFFTFSNSSSSSSNSELAFGDAFSSRTSLPLRRKSSGRSAARRSRRTSDEHLAATVAGIGATAAALATAQRGGRISKRSSKVELGARKDVHRRGRAHTHGSPGSSDDEWEDELPSDVDDESSLDGGLAFGEYGGRRVSSRQSLESINSQSSAGGLGAWGWRWGGKDKKRRSRNSTSPRPSYTPSMADSFNASAGPANGIVPDPSRPYPSGQAVYLDDTGRRLPSMTSTSSPGVPTQPLQFVDPQPISDAGAPGPRHQSKPGAIDSDSPPIYRPGPAPLQQPQPTTPIKPSFTQNLAALEDPNWSRSSPRTPSSNNFVQDAALIGAGALAAGGIIAAASSSKNSSGRKSRDSTGSNVRFGLTEDQQRKEDRERRREEKQADEDRRRADRTRALKEEAERATRESESRKVEEAREARQEEIRRAREDENRRAAEAKLASARREAEEQAQLERERLAEHQRMMTAREEAYRREQARLDEEARLQEQQREADERERFVRQQQEGERRAEERKETEKKSSKSSRVRGQSVSEQNEKKKSSAWGPIAGAAAAATVGAVIASHESSDRKGRDEPRNDSRQRNQQYQAKEVTPQFSHDGEPLTDDEIFDPDFFKRKHTPAERARHEELARKAADKVVSADNFVSDRERAYEDHSTYAEFFAPKDVLSEPAEGKTKVLGPNADNDIQVYHARDADIRTQIDRSRYGAMHGQSRYAPFGVPKLNLISPTPPLSESSPVRSKTSGSSPSSPLAKAAQTAEDVADVETDSDGKSERLNRSISWGEDKTHIYDVQTPESYNDKERDSYITSPDMRAASQDTFGSQKPGEIVVEEVSANGKPKTTTYNEDELAKHYRECAQRNYRNGTGSGPQPSFYHQPFVDSVSDFSFQLPSPGTEGAPPVRGYVEGETDEPTPAEEKAPHIPGGFDDDVDDTYSSRKLAPSTGREDEEPASAGASRESEAADEPAWEPPLSKKEKKKREKASKAVESEPEPTPVAEEPAAWEPPLSKKEQKKRDKAAKRSSTIDSEPSKPASAEPEVVNDRNVSTESPTATQTVEEPAWEPPLSKKEQKKRDKAKKQGFADIVSSLDSLPSESKEADPVEDRAQGATSSGIDEPPLTKKEQRKQEKQAKRSGFSGFADVTDTILASGGIAAAAAALDSTEDDGFSSGGRKKSKKGKKAKLGEPLDREFNEPEPEEKVTEPSAMPGGWDADQESPAPKEETPGTQTAFDPFQYQVHDDESTAPPAAPEAPTAQEVDPWAEFSEPKKSKKKSKRNSSAFNVPEVSSPLRTEVAWDDYVSGDKPSADSRDVGEETTYTNGHGKDKDSETSRSERTPGEPTSTASDRRGSDYFGEARQEATSSSRRTSPDDLRSVASAPTPSRPDDSRRGSDYFDEPSYAYETQSVAASEPADVYGSSKKSKRRSRHEDDEPRRSRRDDDDDTRSVVSSRSRRDKEESPSVKKDKKSGILGSLFGRKSESSREPPRDSKSSKDDEDEDARRRRKKKHRSSEIGDDDDDTRSVVSESRHRSHRSRSDYGDDDDTRSMKSESRHRSHRSETGKEDSRERRRRSTQDDDYDRDTSESGKRHHHRRKSGDDDSRSVSRHESRSESGHRHHHRRRTDEDMKDQSFLGMRVEDTPPLPADIPATSSSVDVGKSEQGVGTPVQTGLDAGMVKNNPDVDEREMSREGLLSPETPVASTENFSPRPGSSHRVASSTAVPLRFPGHAPLTPTASHAKERSMSFSSPVAPSTASTPSSPASVRKSKSRQERPRSTEIKPLYLVERNRKTPEVEDALPSLPSSGPSSRASSVHLSDAYESAVEEIDSSPAAGKKKLQVDIDGAQQWRAEHGDVLGSKETTPKASEAQNRPFFHHTGPEQRQAKQEPQFYTWEDFAREEREHEVDENLPPLPRSRSMSPPKAEQHVDRDGVKVAAAAAVLGTAAVYAAGELRGQSPERVSENKRDAERDLDTANMSKSAESAPVQEAETKAEAPLTRKSSLKKKGKKSKKSLQWQDEEEAAPTAEAPVVEDASHIDNDASAQQIESHNVFPSAAAHTTTYYSPYSRSIEDDIAPTEQTPVTPSTAVQKDEEADRPSTSYKIPAAKAEPAPLVVEERTAAAGTEDAPSETREIKTAPQLTRKQSKKSKKKQKSVSLFEDEQVPAESNTDGAQVFEEPAAAAEASTVEEPTQALDTTAAAPPHHAAFGMSDFSNIAQGPSAGWHDSQAEAFQSAMSESSSRPQPEFEQTREVSASQDDAPAEPSKAQEAADDDFAPVTTKKQGKKSKKQKTALWSDMVEEEQTEPSKVSNAELPREIVDDPAPTVEEPVLSSSSKKKSKKDKKKKSLAWDDPDEQGASTPPPEQVEIEEAVETPSADPTPAAEEPLLSSSSKKKSKKDKKRQSFAWDEPETQEEEVVQPELQEAVKTAEEEDTPIADPTPVAEELLPSSSSKKKSKKDKKRQSLAWDEPETQEQQAPQPDLPEAVETAEPQEEPSPQTEHPDTPAVEEVAPTSSKKKPKKDKKKQSFAWDELEPQQEREQSVQSAVPEATGTAEPQDILPQTEQADTAASEEVAPTSSKKKSKKDKKRQSFAWDEPEAIPDTAQESTRREEADGGDQVPPAGQSESSSADAKPDLEPDVGSSVPPTDSTAADDFTSAVSKKSKKGKKSRQSLAWSDSVPEAAPEPSLGDEDDDAAFVDAEEGQGSQDQQFIPEDKQSSHKDDLTRGVVAAAGSAAAVAAVAGLAHSDKDAASEPPADDFAPVSSKNSKKQKKQKKALDWTAADTETAEPQDEFVDAEESQVVNVPSTTVEEAASVAQIEDAESTPAVVDAQETSQAPLDKTDRDVKPDDAFVPTLTRKQSKKDKKKNRQSQLWEPEPEPSSTEAVGGSPAEQPAGQSAEADMPEAARDVGISADPSNEKDFSQPLSRKQSKKDKKKNRLTSSWEPEPDVQLDEQSTPNEAAVVDAQKAAHEVSHEFADHAEEVPLPADTTDDLATADPLDDTPPANVAESKATGNSGDVHDNADCTETFPALDSQALEAPDMQDDNGVPDTDDFFGPADPSMEEPSRMTEDLGAFGELDDPRAVERENKRAAREAAEAARIAESNRERPKDENYASMLTARKSSVSKKSGKKSRKSVSSVTPPEVAPISQTSPVDGAVSEVLPEPQDDVEFLLSQAVEAAESSVPLDEPQDEDIWTQSSTKKGKKGKKGRKSVSEALPTLEEPTPVPDDSVPTAEASAVDQHHLPIDDVADNFDAASSTQPPEGPQDENEWAMSSKKKGKESKKDRKSLSDGPSALDETPAVTQEAELVDTQFPDPTELPAEDSARSIEPDMAAEQPEAAPAEEDDFGWASGSTKKNKKAKKNKSVGEVALAEEEPRTSDEASAPVATDDTAMPAAEEEVATEPKVEPEDEFAWTSSSKKKGKKGKRNQSVADETSAAGEPSASVEPDLAPENDTSGDVTATEQLSSAVEEPNATMPEVEDEFAWTSGSKKKGKKNRKSQSLAEVAPVVEEPAQAQLDAAYETEAATAEIPPTVNEEPAFIDAPTNEQADANEEADDFSWSSSSKKKGKKGKKNRNSTFEMPAAEVNESAPPETATAAEQDAPEIPAEVEPAQDITTEPPMADEEDVAWATPASKKKGKKGKKSLSETVAPTDEPADARTESIAMDTAEVELQPDAVNNEAIADDVWEMPSSSSKKKKGKKSKRSGSSTPAAEADNVGSQPPVMAEPAVMDTRDESLPVEGDAAHADEQTSESVTQEPTAESQTSVSAPVVEAEQEPEDNTEHAFESEQGQPSGPQEPAEVEEADAWALPAKKKKGKKGKKGLQAEFDQGDAATKPDDIEPRSEDAENGLAQEYTSEVPLEESQQPAEPTADDEWALPPKGKKAKKTKKNKQVWDVDEVPEEPSQPEPTGIAETPANISEPAADRSIDQEVPPTSDSVAEPEPADATPDDSWTVPPKGKKSKKAKKSKQSWEDDEPTEEPSQAEPIEAGGDAPPNEIHGSQPDVSSDTLESAEPQKQHEEQALTAPDDIAAAPVDEVPEIHSQEKPIEETAVDEDREVVDAQPSRATTDAGPPTDSDSFFVKTSKKDKKKGKKNRASTFDPWAEPGNDKTTAEAAPEVTGDDESRSLDAGAAGAAVTAGAVAAGVIAAEASRAEPEEEWGSISTKQSKKDKKKAKKNQSSVPDFTKAEEKREEAEAMPQPEEPEPAAAEMEPKPQPEAETPASTEPVMDDEWASFSTKKSKKDKKKAKQSGSSTPAISKEDEIGEPDPDLKMDDEPVAVAPADDEWANFPTKKSKEDKKKAKQSGSATPTTIRDDELNEPFQTEPAPTQRQFGLEPDPDLGAEGPTATTEPAEDEWANLSTKKSKKDKKKAKQSGVSTSALTGVDDAVTADEPAREADAEEAEAEDLPLETEQPTSSAQVEEPEVDDWTGFSSAKRSKKDKKKAKKSGFSTPTLKQVEEPSSGIRAVSEDLAAARSSQDVRTEPSVELPEADPEPDELPHGEPATLTPNLVEAQKQSNEIASIENVTAEHGRDQSRDLPEKEEPAPSAAPPQDIDFAATLAAGLADSGFNPDLVINDPVFHRRASPPGALPEADPEESFSTTTSKRKKSKKNKSREVEDAPTEAVTPSIPDVQDDTAPRDDFNDTISQGLEGSGFDASLLEKALTASNENLSRGIGENEPEFSFTTTKRKKNKKGKKSSIGADEDVAMIDAPAEIPASDQEDLNPMTSGGADMPHEHTKNPIDLPYEASLQTVPQDDNTRELNEPANHFMGGDGEMDVDEMDKAYKAYKKNKRKQRKLKAAVKTDGSSDNPESALDTGMSAVASDDETRPRGVLGDASQPGKTGPEGFLHTSEISQSLPVAVGKSLPHPENSSSAFNMAAAGVAGIAAGTLASSDKHKRSANGSQAPGSREPGWSFDTLQEGSRGVPDSPLPDNKEHQPIRDSGYEEGHRSQQHSERSSREVPAIIRETSSRESLRNRRSLEPLHISTGSTPDEERIEKTPERRAASFNDNNLHAHTRTPSADTPLLPTSKNRTSYLFQSPPDNLAASAGSSSQSHDPHTPSQRSETSSHSKPRAISEDNTTRAISHENERPPFSPTGAGGPLSPRTPLCSIAEEHHGSKRSKADADVGGPEQNKLTKRSETPKAIQGIRARQRTLSPEISVPGPMPFGAPRSTSNPLSTDDIIKRLSWPAVDEENDTVNIDRSVSRKAIMPDMRSPSVMSNRSATSGTYGRSAQDLRSFSRNSNHSNSSTPSLRRINLSGDLRAASRRGETGSSVSGSAPNTIPFEAPPTPPLNDDELNLGSASRAADMSDVFTGYGDAAESHVSPTRPPSVRKRQSMHINELESRLDSLVAENRALQEARQSQGSSRYVVNDSNLVETLQQRELDLQAKDAEINQIKAMLQPMQDEIARLTEMNNGLTEANRNLVDDTNGRYATLQAEHAQAHEQWQTTTRNLEAMQQEHGRITSGMKDILEAEIATALADKNAEILRLREQLDIATEQIRALQVTIQSSNSSDFLTQRDEDYFDGSCQKLCQHVQQWVLRFSKLSDNRVCRMSTELNDDKLEARLDNAVLDGSDVDKLLSDRVRRRDVFMSVVMTMVWEYIFTRYLFGMDREQRQKLKALEKLLSDVGPPRAVAHWRATTLTLLSKRPNFATQCAMDTEAVAIEIFGVLCNLLPPPSTSEQQLLTSLQRVIRIAVDLSIEMRTQRAEYIMLPPLQPEYDTNGDLVRKVHFNASLMNERSGFFSSNEELAAEHAVVKIVLFPLVVKKGDDIGEGEEEIVVCPAQVLVRNDAGKGKKVVRVMSGAMEIDDPIRSRSRLSSKPSMMSEGGAF